VTRAPRILVADDRPDVLEALRLLLKPEGYEVVTVASPAAALAAVREARFDAALIDLNYARDTTSGREGIDLLARLRAADRALPVVAMTAWGSIEGAVEAMRGGARDYVQKPWDNARLLEIVRAQLAVRSAAAAAPEILGASPAMEAVLRVIDRVGPTDANVLVTGEHGTGKELVARRLHAVSHRRGGPFVAVNAGALAEGLFESELFGHVKGAFTDAKADRIGAFARADGGTLFLDEIGNMPPTQQAKLLRVLQTGEISAVGSSKVDRADVRVVAATNADLAAAIREGRFRADLLYRLNTVEIRLPPLRERAGDVLFLAARFLARAGARHGRPEIELTGEAARALAAHAWPGNVRELEHVIERAVLLAAGDRIGAADLALGTSGEARDDLDGLTLDEAEQLVIDRALRRCAGNVNEAARALGMSRSALYRRLQQRPGKGPS
jgi:DNA-binding NtrC family response regulator